MNGLIVFFYVDDIAICFRKDHREKAEQLVADLQAAFEFKVISELE